MQTVSVNGDVYTKASVLAKRFGYTADYIGQLCRANKVDAQLIGRSWYVNEFSLQNHKDSRYEALRGNDIISKISVNQAPTATLEKPAIRPSLSKKTFRSFPQSVETQWEKHLSMQSSPTTYEADTGDLFPKSMKPIVPVLPVAIPITLSGASKVLVQEPKENQYLLRFSEVPSVSMSGSLRVQDVESDFDSFIEPHLVTASKPPEKNSFRKKIEGGKTEIQSSVAAIEGKNPVFLDSPLNFTPVSLKKTVPVRTNVSFILLSISLSAAIAFLVITLDTQIVSNGVQTDHRLVFNTASLFQFFLSKN